MAKLSPTPRKSERDKKPISYDKLIRGVDSDDNDLRDSKKNDKRNVLEVHKRVMDLLQTMNKHEAASLFNQTLDVNHPLYTEVKSEFTTLGMMDLKFKIGNKYQTTDEIAQEFRKMIMIKFRIILDAEPNTYNLIESFRQQFEQEF